MSIDPILKETLAKYRQNKLLLGFAWLRSIHAAYQQIESLVPERGCIIDVGCGYGFFANYMALKSPKRKVIGLEINKRKLDRCRHGVKNVDFKNVALETFPDRFADAVVLYHVLHHLRSFDEQERLLQTAVRVLKTGGVLIIVEVDGRPLWKYWVAWWVDHLLYFGDRIFYRTKNQMLRLLQGDLNLNVRSFRCDRFAPFSHIAYVASRLNILPENVLDEHGWSTSKLNCCPS